MPAASKSPVVGKMSSRVLNMKFMQRKTNKSEDPNTQGKGQNDEEEKLQIKDTSEWSFSSRKASGIANNLKNKKLRVVNTKTPITLSQTVLNKKISSYESTNNTSLIGKKQLGIKDELEKELEKGVEEEVKEKDLETLFKESNEMNKKSKKRKHDSDDHNEDNKISKKKNKINNL